ncbi:MAG: helix-turn-helix transcriptional regulator [Anaerolineae bacterium]|nr:helix-turn-helix transcriptional regulator [Anaerolineae bacterium]
MRGDRLRELRLARELTQQELAQRVGVHPQHIYKLEVGKYKPNSDTLIRLARELEVSADYLLGLVDDLQGHLSEEDLTPVERKLLSAWRHADTRKMLEFLMEIGKDEDASITPGEAVRSKP